MRTSLLETKRIEEHLQGMLDPGEQLLFQAELILDPDRREKVEAQRKAYALLRSYGRNQLKEEIARVHARLFESPLHHRFKLRIVRFFQNP